MITGGGTGGHTSPAVAIIEELRKRDPRLDVQWVGRKGAIEERVSKTYSVPFRSVPVEGWPRERSLKQVWVGAKLALGVGRSLLLIRKFRPQLVLGVGGYVSLPLILAAQRMKVPTILHEQNKRLGLANRLAAGRASLILLSYPETVGEYPRERAAVLGNPVRAGFAHPPAKADACAVFELDPEAPVVLVSGGSQGAHTLNQAMFDLLEGSDEAESAQFIWMTGPADAGRAHAVAEQSPIRARVFAFIDDMVSACAAADLIVSRAGASSTAEIALLGKPSILVPYPFATDNHQEQNARAFEDAGAACVLLDNECTGARLRELIEGLVGDEARLRAMGVGAASLARPGAAEAIAEQILSTVFE